MKKIYLTVFLAFLLLAGCKTRYFVPTNTTTPTSHELSVKDIINQFDRANLDINYLNIPNAEANFSKGGSSYSIRIGVKIIKNQEINISILPILGVEMFRIKLTPQRFYIFDKLNRNYCDNSYQYLTDILKVDITYEDIEALLSNRLFSLVRKDNIEKAYNSMQLADRFLLISKEKIGGYDHSFELSPEYMLYSTMLNNSLSNNIRVNYSMFVVDNKVLFPTLLEMSSILPNNTFDLKITIKKLEINKPFEVNVIDLNRYSKVDCSKMFMR